MAARSPRASSAAAESGAGSPGNAREAAPRPLPRVSPFHLHARSTRAPAIETLSVARRRKNEKLNSGGRALPGARITCPRRPRAPSPSGRLAQPAPASPGEGATAPCAGPCAPWLPRRVPFQPCSSASPMQPQFSRVSMKPAVSLLFWNSDIIIFFFWEPPNFKHCFPVPPDTSSVCNCSQKFFGH